MAKDISGKNNPCDLRNSFGFLMTQRTVRQIVNRGFFEGKKSDEKTASQHVINAESPKPRKIIWQRPEDMAQGLPLVCHVLHPKFARVLSSRQPHNVLLPLIILIMTGGGC